MRIPVDTVGSAKHAGDPAQWTGQWTGQWAGQWLEKLDDGCRLSDHELAGALEALIDRPALSIEALSGSVLDELTEAASRLPFRAARYQVGKPGRRVYQELGYCGAVPAVHPLRALSAWLETKLNRALRAMAKPPVNPGFQINDVVCQVYRPGDLGITPHRDHIAYTGLIVLVVLSGRGRYRVCADRQGHGEREIPSAPGSAILMPGPGYAGRTDRPFHTVGDIERLRYSVGLRHDAHKAPTDGA